MIKFLGKTLIVSTAIVAVPIVFLNRFKKWVIETNKDEEFKNVFRD